LFIVRWSWQQCSVVIVTTSLSIRKLWSWFCAIFSRPY